MAESDAHDDDIRYNVVKHGSQWRIEDALNPNDGNGVSGKSRRCARAEDRGPAVIRTRPRSAPRIWQWRTGSR